VFGHKPRLAHAHHGEQHPLLRQIGISFGVAALLAIAALLLLPPHAHGNFVYWANSQGTSLGRAKINGTGLNNNFIPATNPFGVATDSKFVYWEQPNSIGRANLDGSGPNPAFVTTGSSTPLGLAVTSSAIFWVSDDTHIGRVNLDGTNPQANFITAPGSVICGIAADANFVYWADTGGMQRIGRAPVAGGSSDPSFITAAGFVNCGIAVDSNFLYWATRATPSPPDSIARAPVAGGAPNLSFISSPTPASKVPCGVAVNTQFVFWGSASPGGNDPLGRADIGGGSPNPTFLTPGTRPCLVAAAPSNKITVNSVSKNKKKGTASINTKVPGPGQVTLNQTNTPPDVNATAAGVKQVGLTITQASSFKLAVKPTGKTAKKLSKQIKKQLKKKNKAKAKASVTVFIHFVPAGISGVPNTQQVKVTLIKQAKKKK
jgi:hypothetical protein